MRESGEDKSEFIRNSTNGGDAGYVLGSEGGRGVCCSVRLSTCVGGWWGLGVLRQGRQL